MQRDRSDHDCPKILFGPKPGVESRRGGANSYNTCGVGGIERNRQDIIR